MPRSGSDQPRLLGQLRDAGLEKKTDHILAFLRSLAKIEGMNNSNEQSHASCISDEALKAQQIEAGREVFMAAVGKIVESEGVSFSAAVPKAAQFMADIVRGEAFDGDLKMAAVASLAFAKDKWNV